MIRDTILGTIGGTPVVRINRMTGSSDAEVLGQMSIAWWFFVAIMPVAGIVFALDGVLLGAGDVVFLRKRVAGE